VTRAEFAALDQQPRPVRLRLLWFAMSPAAQRKCWDALRENGRVELIAACFDAEEVRDG
jgi:hypothetical protein